MFKNVHTRAHTQREGERESQASVSPYTHSDDSDANNCNE